MAQNPTSNPGPTTPKAQQQPTQAATPDPIGGLSPQFAAAHPSAGGAA